MKWTQKELEELYSKVNERALNDPEFKEKVIKDIRAALEEVAGCELPEELGLKYIEKDNSFRSTYVTPDFAQGEIDVNELREVGGGAGGYAQSGSYKNKQKNSNDVGVFLIVSVCGVAADIGPDAGLCGFAACPADACAAQACGGKVCAGFACAAEGCGVDNGIGRACGAQGCAAVVCGADACAADANGVQACGIEACGAEADGLTACKGVYGCGAQATGFTVCPYAACGADATVLEACGVHGCAAQAAGAKGCIADATLIGACGAKIDVVGVCGGDACGAEACGIEGCGADACGADINGAGVEFISVCNTDAIVVDKPFGYDIPTSGIDICGTNIEGMVSDDAAVNDAE